MPPLNYTRFQARKGNFLEARATKNSYDLPFHEMVAVQLQSNRTVSDYFSLNMGPEKKTSVHVVVDLPCKSKEDKSSSSRPPVSKTSPHADIMLNCIRRDKLSVQDIFTVKVPAAGSIAGLQQAVFKVIGSPLPGLGIGDLILRDVCFYPSLPLTR